MSSSELVGVIFLGRPGRGGRGMIRSDSGVEESFFFQNNIVARFTKI